jgi:hypothetical protein
MKGIKTIFSANLRKKRADGSIVYHDNAFLNWVIKMFAKR